MMLKILLFISIFFNFAAADNVSAENTASAISLLRAVNADRNIEPPVMPVYIAPADSTFVALPQAKDKGPVILTIPGIVPSSIWSYIFGRITPDGKKVEDERAASQNDEWLKQYFDITSDSDFKIFKEEILAQAEEYSRSGDDDYYLEWPLKKIPEFQNLNLELHTFIWSRNPLDSAVAVTELMNTIQTLSGKAFAEGRPFHIYAHSWGTVLSHTALKKLAYSGRNVKVDNWVTTGSPLIPGNKIIKRYVNFMAEKGNLEKDVSMPGNVRHWVNIWGKRDLISNSIPMCQNNIQSDTSASYYENLIRTLHFGFIGDWIRMRNPISWHSVYHEDFHKYLRSANTKVDILVFSPYVQPRLIK